MDRVAPWPRGLRMGRAVAVTVAVSPGRKRQGCRWSPAPTQPVAGSDAALPTPSRSSRIANGAAGRRLAEPPCGPIAARANRLAVPRARDRTRKARFASVGRQPSAVRRQTSAFQRALRRGDGGARTAAVGRQPSEPHHPSPAPPRLAPRGAGRDSGRGSALRCNAVRRSRGDPVPLARLAGCIVNDGRRTS